MTDRWRPKLVASDMDGTLLYRWALSDRTWAAIQAVRAAGIDFVVATGRSAAFLRPLPERGYDGPAVCDNGAVVYDVGRHETLASWLIPPDVLSGVVADFAAEVPEGYFAVNRTNPDATARFAEPRMVERWGVFGFQPLPREALADEPAAKLTVRLDGVTSDILADRLAPIAGDRVTVAWSSLEEGLIECSAPGVTKATGIAWYAEKMGIDAADVLAMGDMNNDLALLGWAGRSIAPANAHPTVKAVVDEVVGPIEQDGTAAYLESLLQV